MEITAETVWTIMFSTASAIVLISNAVEKIVKAYKSAKAPNIRQDERLLALEKWKDSVERRLNADNDSLRDIEKGDRAMQRALLALLDHGIDGNNIKQMEDAKEELQNHLINK